MRMVRPILRAAATFLCAKRQPLVLLLLVLVFSTAAWFRAKAPDLPISDPDSWGYLFPALSHIAGEGFQQTHGRGFAYPLFLLAVLSATGDFFAIPATQHLLGLAAGVVWWAVWREWRHWLPEAIRDAFGVQLAGLLFLAAFLWNAHAIYYETMFRPEAVFPFLALCQTLLTLVFVRNRWSPGGSWGSMVAAGAASMAMALVCLSAKPSWGFSAAVPFVVVAAGVFGWKPPQPLPARLAAPFLGILLCGLWASALPAATRWKKDERSREFLPATLFTVHAPAISTFLNGKLTMGLLGKEEVSFLEKLDRRIAESVEMVRSGQSHYQQLGHDPDYLMYHSDTLAWLPWGSGAAEKRRFMISSYTGSLFADPGYHLQKFSGQMRMAFSNLRHSLYKQDYTFEKRLHGSLKSMDSYKLPAIPAGMAGSYSRVRSETENLLGKPPQKIVFGPSLRDFFAFSIGPFLMGAAMLVWPIFVLIFAKQRLGGAWSQNWFPPTLVFGVFWSSCLGTTATVAAVHSFDITRYAHLLSGQQSLVLAAVVSAAFAGVLGKMKKAQGQQEL